VSAPRHGIRARFAIVNGAALKVLPTLLRNWLPSGTRRGEEWVALNPRRADRRLGSFKINLRTGRWADFSTGDGGSDVVSLAAYLAGVRQGEACRRLASLLRVSDER
jgi:hypothetical protein